MISAVQNQVICWFWRENKGKRKGTKYRELLTLVSQGKVMAHSEYI